MLPPAIDLSLSGHVHLWEQVSYVSGFPSQIIAGLSGTQEDTVPLPAAPPKDATPVPGGVVRSMSSWVTTRL